MVPGCVQDFNRFNSVNSVNSLEFPLALVYFWFLSLVTCGFEMWGPRGVLRISSDGDARMEPKVKTQKNPKGFQQNPKKSLDQKLTPKKSHADFVALKSSRKG